MYEKLGSGVLLILKVVKEGFPFINFHFYICTVGLCVCAHVCAGVGACVQPHTGQWRTAGTLLDCSQPYSLFK